MVDKIPQDDSGAVRAGLAWRRAAETVTSACAAHLPGMAGVYVHGSAALGGFAAASDLDVLVVTEDGRGCGALGPALVRYVLPHPLELSVVTAADAARAAAPWTYLLHVNGAEGRCSGPGEDPDLVAHYLVTRAAGVALHGPAARDVIGEVARDDVLAYLDGELDWGLAHGDERYAVLNACRAAAYARESLVLAKVDGARWWADRIGPDAVVEQALEAQMTGTVLGPARPEARAHVRRAQAMLRERQ